MKKILLLIVFVGFSFLVKAQVDSSKTGVDTLSLIMKSIDRLIELNTENTKKTIVAKRNIEAAGDYLVQGKNYFLYSGVSTGIGLVAAYSLHQLNLSRINNGYEVSDFGLVLPNRILIVSTSLSFGFMINSFVRLGKAGDSLRNL